MQKKLNDIEKTWHELNVALVCSDFLGASQRLRKMILQLKMLKADVGWLMDIPHPELTVGSGWRLYDTHNR